MALPRYSVKSLVWAGTLLLLSITTLLIVAVLWLGSQIDAQVRLTERTHEVSSLLADIERDVVRAESAQRAFALVGREEFLTGFEAIDSIGNRLETLQQLISDNPSQVPRATQLRQAIDEKVAFMNRCISLKRSRDPELVNLIASGQGARLGQEVHRIVAEMSGVEASLLVNRRLAVRQSQDLWSWTLLAGLAIDLVLGFAVLNTLSRRLVPLSTAALFAEKIGQGDLSGEPLPVQAEDEVGSVTASLNRMLANLRNAAQQTRNSGDVVNTTAAKLASATREQAVALQQQSTAMQQTSVTLEELAQSAGQIADRAREVASRSEATSQAAAQGLEAVRKSVGSTQALVDQVRVVAERINSLSQKTDAIRSIVLSVNDFAERSNVLALNAAILAAAAGPEGKSFTVVANEMKSLADQSKDATVQVRDLLGEVERGIQASVVLIEEAGKRGLAGTTYSDEASVAIHQLTGQVNEGNLAFQQIVAATNQQKLAFEQVSEALLSIRQATGQSAATTGQLETATSELHRLSGDLIKSLETYKLDKRG